MTLLYDVIITYITGGVSINENRYLCVHAPHELKKIVKNLEYPVNITDNRDIGICGEISASQESSQMASAQSLSNKKSSSKIMSASEAALLENSSSSKTAKDMASKEMSGIRLEFISLYEITKDQMYACSTYFWF